MLFTRGDVKPGSTILVQGAGGGVATALIVLAHAAGIRTGSRAATKQSATKRTQLGADQAFEPNARLPERVDAVLETVGAATWSHSLKSLKPGGTLVVSGATSGQDPSADLNRVFFLQLSVVGSTMGTRDELDRLARMCAQQGIRPTIDATYPLEHAREALTRLNAGDVFGKLVLTG